MITLISNGHPLSEIGIKSLIGYLEHFNIPTRAIYLDQCGLPSKELIKQILDLTKDSLLVGFSMMSKDVIEFKPIIEEIRHEQKIPTIVGGIHPTALPEESLEFSDFICRGEGEEPIKQLYLALLNKNNDFNIPNIGYKEHQKKVINPTTYFIESLDTIPYYDSEFKDSYIYVKSDSKIKKIPLDQKNKYEMLKYDTLFLNGQRGCPFSCTYCSNALYHELANASGNKWYRTASPKRIKEELKFHLKNLPFTKKVFINDDDFLMRSIEELREISGFIKNELHMVFSINAIPSPVTVTDEKISLLVNNGLRKIGFGVQSGSNKILKNIYKRFVTREQVLDAAKIVAKYCNNNYQGFYPNYGFILDNPYDREDDWRDSLKLLISLPRPRTINLYSLTFFAGTKLTEKAINDGYLSSVSSQYDKDYREDINYSYANTLFFLNAFYPVPPWLNNIFLSNFMVKSTTAAPLRSLLKHRNPILKMLQSKTTLFIIHTFRKIQKNLNFSLIKKTKNKIFRLTIDLYEKLKNPYSQKDYLNKARTGWSVVIITNGKSNETLLKTIASAEKELHSSNGEIIIVGPPNLPLPANSKIKIKYIRYYDSKRLPGLITRKKNLGARAAEYDKLVICHDYIFFEAGWKNGYDKFGDNFDVCINKIINLDGKRNWDWVTFDYPNIGMALLPYDTECTRYQFIGGMYFVVKRDFFLANPLNEKLRWAEAEDIDWSKRIRKKTIFKFNPFSTVSFSKLKPGLSHQMIENSIKLEKILKYKII